MKWEAGENLLKFRSLNHLILGGLNDWHVGRPENSITS